MVVSKRNLTFQGSTFRGEHVSFREGVLLLGVGVALLTKWAAPSLDDDESLLKIMVQLKNQLISKIVIMDLQGFYKVVG